MHASSLSKFRRFPPFFCRSVVMQFCVSFLQVGALSCPIPPVWLLLALLCCTLWEHASTIPMVGMPLEAVATQLLRWPALRIAFILALLVHEWAHLLASLIVNGGSGAGGPANWRANVSLHHWWQCLLPWKPVPRTMAPHIRGPGLFNSHKFAASEGGNMWKDVGVRGAGWGASAALCVVSWNLGGALGRPSGTLLQEEMLKVTAQDCGMRSGGNHTCFLANQGASLGSWKGDPR